jgi:Homeodomain-like domain
VGSAAEELARAGVSLSDRAGAATGRSSKEIAAELGCTANTVGRWRVRFARRGLGGLHDEPRPGKPRTVRDEDFERMIVKTLEEQPVGARHWSTRSGRFIACATRSSTAGRGRSSWRSQSRSSHHIDRRCAMTFCRLRKPFRRLSQLVRARSVRMHRAAP